MSKRFNRKTLVEHLWSRWEDMKIGHNFNPNTGTNQLRGTRLSRDALISRAVLYGRWMATKDFAIDVREGFIGVPEEPASHVRKEEQ